MGEYSGVLGLNIDSFYNIPKQEGLIYNMYTQRKIKNPIFALYLPKLNDKDSKIDIGEIDEDIVKNKTVYWVNTKSNSHWCISIDKIAINTKESVAIVDMKAIIDTSYTYTTIPLSKILTR